LDRTVRHRPSTGDAELLVSVGHEALLANKLRTSVRDTAQILKWFKIIGLILTAVFLGLLFTILREHL
jgi:hypothetical protein